MAIDVYKIPWYMNFILPFLRRKIDIEVTDEGVIEVEYKKFNGKNYIISKEFQEFEGF